MSETFILRNKPELKIVLKENGIEIFDAYDSINSDKYHYSQIKNVTYHEPKPSWFLSTFSWLIDILINTSSGKKYNSKPYLKFQLINKTFKIWLLESDLEKSKALTELIKNKTYT
ncbi:hypothetical protein [Robertkochia sediminum]|uniref:hypothetical protein n=1 Tax=Robertkochia sediminum TaxID=2785326 RepID=UPI00193236FF|nr:hypothetical protein [Robertkochia sediminum]MBL7471526.1 hypothetical protein [Robertkochia sediminum]